MLKKKMTLRKRSLLISIGVCLILFLCSGCSRQSQLEKEAPPVVEQMLKNSFLGQMGMEMATCTKVTIVEKLGKNTYEAIAELSNGNTMRIRITDMGDKFLVELIQ